MIWKILLDQISLAWFFHLKGLFVPKNSHSYSSYWSTVCSPVDKCCLFIPLASPEVLSSTLRGVVQTCSRWITIEFASGQPCSAEQEDVLTFTDIGLGKLDQRVHYIPQRKLSCNECVWNWSVLGQTIVPVPGRALTLKRFAPHVNIVYHDFLSSESSMENSFWHGKK